MPPGLSPDGPRAQEPRSDWIRSGPQIPVLAALSALNRRPLRWKTLLGRVEHDAVAPLVLGAVERLVGPLEEIRVALLHMAHDGDAERDRHCDGIRPACDHEGVAMHGFTDALGDGLSPAMPGIG